MNDQFNVKFKNKYKKAVYLNDYGINESQILIVDDKTYDFDKIYEQIRNCELNQIGLDTEKHILEKQISILQLAVYKQVVYLFDLQKLRGSEGFKKLIKQVFEDRNIKKIGHSFLGEEIERVLKQIFGYVVVCNNVVDVQQQFKEKYNQDSLRSLSFIVNSLFSKELLKDEQISNWQLSKLRKAQLHYAALDAYIVIVVYIELQKTNVHQNNDLSN